LGDEVKNTEMGRVRSTYGGKEGNYRVLVRKPEGRRLLGRPWCRIEDNIKVDLTEVEWGHGLDRSNSG
jgi:hypothetical protein